MNLFTKNKDFYTTTPELFIEMYHMIPRKARQEANYIIDPSAGSGFIIEQLKKDNFRRTYHAIENDPELIAMLQGKGITVINHDFLTYSGTDKYDIIIANPPFSEGDKHLLKAIDIMYSGHIVFLLNAETIKNPCTNSRRMLTKKLEQLNATIKYKKDAFAFANRKTGVEIAMIHIHIDRLVETDLFGGVTQTQVPKTGTIEDSKELTQKDSIKNMVAGYNRRVEIGTQTLLDYYKNYHHIGDFIHLATDLNDLNRSNNLTEELKKSLNLFLKNLRQSYWQDVLLLDKVKERMTVNKRKEFEKALQDNSFMDFTESNIRQFILNLINSYEDILTTAVLELFESMTHKYAYDEDLFKKNTHYFDGWKTNQAYYVNKKVIVPFYYQEAFWDTCWEKWNLSYRVKEELNDIDKVMNYFDGKSKYFSIVDAINGAFDRGQTKKILSTYFKINVYKKGTCHLIFRDKDILRRFNVTACKGKSWLPNDYGTKKYQNLAQNEKDLIKSFEGKKIYNQNVVESGTSLFRIKKILQLTLNQEAEAA
jgi:methylase of polypeptide subunit release factors